MLLLTISLVIMRMPNTLFGVCADWANTLKWMGSGGLDAIVASCVTHKWFQSPLITSELSHWTAGNDVSVESTSFSAASEEIFCWHRHKVLIRSNAVGQRSGSMLCSTNAKHPTSSLARKLSFFFLINRLWNIIVLLDGRWFEGRKLQLSPSSLVLFYSIGLSFITFNWVETKTHTDTNTSVCQGMNTCRACINRGGLTNTRLNHKLWEGISWLLKLTF